MKPKTYVLVGIAVCVLFLTSPVLANAGYSKIYGNANEDDTLDMRDVTYIKLVIFGKKPATDLADANYDGKVSMLDIGQTKLIILDKEKKLTLVDHADRTVTVKKPVEKVVAFNHGMFVTMRSIKAADKVVGVCQNLVRHYGVLFPEVDEYPKVGSFSSPNYEAVLNLNPDVVVLWGEDEEILEKFKQIDPSITIICFDCDNPSYYVEEVRKSGYILEKKRKPKSSLISMSNI